MATIVKTPSGSWKAVVRKTGWPQVIKTFGCRSATDLISLKLWRVRVA